MDELLEQFLIEGRDLVAEAHGALISLGRDQQDPAALDSLFRATHTLKGSVALFDMAPAEHTLHAAESLLEAVRKGKGSLGPGTLDVLVGIIDQTDRWIDAMETQGALDGEAQAIAARIIAVIADGSRDGPSGRFQRPAGALAQTADHEAEWLAALRARRQFAVLDPGRPSMAFRYTPDTDCFFRGEDPLALAVAVPGLLALAVLPAAEIWPDLTEFDPFRCVAVIEGVSTADDDALRIAFRLVPDQVVIAPFATTEMPAMMRREVEPETLTMLRVDAAKLDRLADQSGELGVAARALGPLAARIRTVDPGFAADLRAVQDEIERVAGTLRRSIAQVRLVSLEPVLRRLPRLARETAAGLGKPIRFHLTGETTEVDKQIADQLFEPLLHLIRNAIDHGIEAPADRTASNKPEAGIVKLSVRQDGETIAVSLSDDGRGIDPAAIRDVAVARNLIARDIADTMSDGEALRLIFLPGFSTASQVTAVSGRGIGMDAVKASIERLAGVVAIDSAVGKGTRIELRLPANAISTKLLVVAAGREHLGIRLDQIVETVRIAASEIQPIGLGQVCVLRDTTVPVLDLADLLGLGQTDGEQARLVITEAGGSRTALRVDGLGERFDSVVRECSGLLAAIPAVAGTALRADGSVLLILDLTELVA